MPIIDAQLDRAVQAFRSGDLAGATRLAKEAIAAARATDAPITVAYTLRHTANLLSKAGSYAEAAVQIEEAIAIYREQSDANTLNLSNALRVAALNHERTALAIWSEAKNLYTTVEVQAGIDGATHHIQQLSELLGGIS